MTLQNSFSFCSIANDKLLSIPQMLVGASFRTRWPPHMTSDGPSWLPPETHSPLADLMKKNVRLAWPDD